MKEDTTKQSSKTTNILKCYTFENFVVGENNNFALAFARAVCENPGKEYNPLFIYSNVGLGKTHIINAIGNEISAKLPEKNIVYTSSQQFEAELVEAIQFNKVEQFREQYTSLDVLLLDDVQFIASRESAQQEFFHAFNILFNSGKQIVLTSDRPPSTLSTLEQRLRSRFEGGIITEIMPPDLETRKAILCKKLEEKKAVLQDDVIHMLCENIKDDIRKLEGALKETIAFANLTKKPVTVEIAEQVINQKLAQYDKLQAGFQSVVDTKLVNLAKKTQIKLESPHDTLNNDETQPRSSGASLKIDVSLPPKQKKSMIKMPTKNIMLGNNDNTQEQTSAPQTPAVAPLANQAGTTPRLTPAKGIAPTTDQDKDTVDFIKKMEEGFAGDGLSVTNVFSAQSINDKVREKKGSSPVGDNSLIDEQNLSITQATSSLGEKLVKPIQPVSEQEKAPILDANKNAGSNVSLTNIFSSSEVKEKINQIIAGGANKQTSDDNSQILGASPAQTAAKSNVFLKEHKRKLNYELKCLDSYLRKINKGKITITDFDAFDDFTGNLQAARQAYKDGQLQQGLDFVRDTKKALSIMVDENIQTGMFDNGLVAMLSTNKISVVAGLVGIFILIFIIIWIAFFAKI